MKRRALLASVAALGASLGVAGRVRAAKPLASNELVLSELKLPGDPAFGRALLAVPKRLPAKPSLLVLLHGLGETHDQEVGSRAFAERYGLLSAVSRLTNPPIERTVSVPLDETAGWLGSMMICTSLVHSPTSCCSQSCSAVGFGNSGSSFARLRAAPASIATTMAAIMSLYMTLSIIRPRRFAIRTPGDSAAHAAAASR